MHFKMVLFLVFLSINVFADGAKEWNAETYNKYSDSQKKAAQKVLDRLKLTGKEKVLDVGSGDGKITAKIAESALSVIGVDNSDSMVTFANNNFAPGPKKNLSFLNKDAAKLDFNEAFHVVVSFNTIQWVLEPKHAFDGMYKALQSGGKLLVTIPAGYPDALANALDDLMNLDSWKSYFKEFTLKQVFLPTQDYIGFLKQAGFSNVKVTRATGFDTFASLEIFGNFVRQWLPHLHAIPADKKDRFMSELMNRYAYHCPNVSETQVPFYKYNIEMEADKLAAKQDL